MRDFFKNVRIRYGEKYSVRTKTKRASHIQLDAPALIAEDTLGFKSIADRLAPSIANLVPSKSSIVVGVEGRWGSGKTTLLHAICEHPDLKNNGALKVINIAPWLSGNTESPVSVLMNEICSHLEATNTKAAQKLKTNRARTTLQQYAGATAKHGGAVLGALAALSSSGSIDVASKVAGKTGSVINAALAAFSGGKSSSQIKDEVAAIIRDANLCFLVILDDLDRLEPNELAEAVRLVKSVGDLPNTIFMICYDRSVVANALQRSLGVENGFAYLEKIVQLHISIPLPEIFVLRRMLLTGLEKIFEDVHGTQADEDVSGRLQLIVNYEGTSLLTPRAVKSVLNAVAFTYPEVNENVDFSDFCWVQMLRNTRPELHSLIERYLSVFSQVSVGTAEIGEVERGSFGEEFTTFFPSSDAATAFDPHSGSLLLNLVPGLSLYVASVEAKDRVFAPVSQSDGVAAFRMRRLASVSHWRYYFAMAAAEDVWSEEDFATLAVCAASGKENALFQLRAIAKRERRYGEASFPTFVQYYLQWLDVGMIAECKNSMLAIADFMDEVTPRRSEFGAGIEGIIGFSVIDKLREMNEENPRSGFELLKKILLQGKALHWLFGWLFCRHVHDHGLSDGETKYPEKTAMNAAETSSLIKPMIDRIKDAEEDGSIWRFPRLGGVLAFLRGLDSDDAVFNMIEGRTANNDEAFLKVLDQVRGTRSSNRVSHPIGDDAMTLLFRDAEAAEHRLRLLATNGSENSEMAAELVEALELGREF